MAGLRGLGQEAKTAPDDVKVLRKFLEQFRHIPILDGQLVTGVVRSGQTAGFLTHSLGRPYLGGFVVGVSAAESLLVQTPAEALAGGLGAGVDTRNTLVVFTPSAVAADTTVNVWVF